MANQPKWVLHLCGMMSVGGVQAMLMSFYEHIDKSKVQFAFGVQRNFSYEYDNEINKLGGRVHFLPDMTVDKKAYKKALKKLLKEYPEYKIVHCHFNHRNWVMLDIARKMGVPVRISHAHASNVKKRLTTKIHLGYLSFKIRKYATDLYACSNASGKYLYCSDNYVLIHNAIDLEKFKYKSNIRNQLREEWGIKDNEILIGQVGHINENKNQLFSVEILSKLNENFKLFIVGEGPSRPQIEKTVSDKGLEERVKFLNVRKDVFNLMNAFDFLIFPSIHEGLAVVCIEAQACGLNVVASDNVPSEIKVTDLAVQLSLNDTSSWVNYFKSIKPENRVSPTKQLVEAGYDINQESAKLEKLYLQAYDRISDV